VASVFAINHVIKKEYPWLHKVKTPAKGAAVEIQRFDDEDQAALRA